MTRNAMATKYHCQQCDWSTSKWVGRCNRCGSWDSLVETVGTDCGSRLTTLLGSTKATNTAPAQPIDQIDTDQHAPWPTGIGEFDRVLGGGLMPGSVVLLAGEPGIGKSTLLLDVAARIAQQGKCVLYATGEESVEQVGRRANRISAMSSNLLLSAINDLGVLVEQINQVKPSLLIVDSVQTLTAQGLEGGPGGVSQVRGVASGLVELAKTSGLTVVLVGHVTKDGSLAGPRALEHIVDVVCSFEGERTTALRILRASKNRHGPAEEIGCFTMAETGICEVSDPTGLFTQLGSSRAPGTCLGLVMEGRRPMAVEVQTLVAQSTLASPRRTTSGVDSARLAMTLAVLQRHCSISLSGQDVYAATVGGVHVNEPGLDLALALACASSRWDVVLPNDCCAIGEVGLGGEVRPVRHLDRRLAEAARLGLTRAFVPAGTQLHWPAGLVVVEVVDLRQAVTQALQEVAITN